MREYMAAELSGTAALRDAFRLSICAYADCSRYQDMLLGLLEDIDESHEDYDPESSREDPLTRRNSIAPHRAERQ